MSDRATREQAAGGESTSASKASVGFDLERARIHRVRAVGGAFVTMMCLTWTGVGCAPKSHSRKVETFVTSERTPLEDAIAHDQGLPLDEPPGSFGGAVEDPLYELDPQARSWLDEYPTRHLVVELAVNRAMLPGPPAVFTTALRNAVVQELADRGVSIAPATVLAARTPPWPGPRLKIVLTRFRSETAVDFIDVDGPFAGGTSERTLESTAASATVSTARDGQIWAWESTFDSTIERSKAEGGLLGQKVNDRRERRLGRDQILRGLASDIAEDLVRRIEQDEIWRLRLMRPRLEPPPSQPPAPSPASIGAQPSPPQQ